MITEIFPVSQIDIMRNELSSSVATLRGEIAITSASIPTAAFENRWTDLQGTFDNSTMLAALTFEALPNGFSTYFFRHDQNDSFQMRFQMPHSWNGGPVRPHLHIVPTTAPLSDQYIEWGYQLAWVGLHQQLPTTWITGSVRTTVEANVSGTMEKKVLLGTLTPVDPHTSDFILMRVMRSGSAASDTYTTSKSSGTQQANVALLGFDIHFQMNSAGTTSEY